MFYRQHKRAIKITPHNLTHLYKDLCTLSLMRFDLGERNTERSVYTSIYAHFAHRPTQRLGRAASCAEGPYIKTLTILLIYSQKLLHHSPLSSHSPRPRNHDLIT